MNPFCGRPVLLSLAHARTLRAFNAMCYAASLPESGPDRAPRPISRAALTGKLACARQTLRGYEKAAGVKTVQNHVFHGTSATPSWDIERDGLDPEKLDRRYLNPKHHFNGVDYDLLECLPNGYVAPLFERAPVGQLYHLRKAWKRAALTDGGSVSKSCKRYYSDPAKAIKRRNKNETAYLCNGSYRGRKDVFEWSII
jgi:hypothetical protein